MDAFDEATTRLLKAQTSPGPVTSPEVTVQIIVGPDAGARITLGELPEVNEEPDEP